MTVQKGLIIASIIVFILGIFLNFGVGQIGMMLLGSALFAGGHL